MDTNYYNLCKLWFLPCMFNLFLAMFVYWILHWILPSSLITPRIWPFFHLIFISGLHFLQHYSLWPASICHTTISGSMALKLWFSTSSSLIWEHVINANSEAPPQTYWIRNQGSHGRVVGGRGVRESQQCFNKPSRSFQCTLNCENHCFR